MKWGMGCFSERVVFSERDVKLLGEGVGAEYLRNLNNCIKRSLHFVESRLSGGDMTGRK